MFPFQVQPMDRLLPIMRLHQQLKKGIQGRYTHEQPVERNEQRPGQEMVLLPFCARQQVEIDVEEVSKNEAERAQVKNGTWEQHVIDVYYRGAKDNVNSQ